MQTLAPAFRLLEVKFGNLTTPGLQYFILDLGGVEKLGVGTVCMYVCMYCMYCTYICTYKYGIGTNTYQ